MLGNTSPTLEPSGVPPKVVQAQVDKILASDLFANAGNLSRFLRFIVDQTLDGQGEHLKEYRIAVEVFGRGEGFDPKEDTIVRVQARNLRAKLANYYESEGRDDAVIIELPKGRYAPSFRSARPLRKNQVERPRSALYLGLVLIVALAAGAYWIARRPARGGIQPSLLVWPFSDASPEEGRSYLANGICTDLITALAKTKAVRVVRAPTGLRGDAATALGSGRQYGAQFVLTGNVRAAEGKISLKAGILRTRDGSQIWEQEFARPAAELSSVLEESARAVLRKLRIDWPKERPLITSRAANLEAYDLYQRALLENAGGHRAALLEQAIARDPKYAPAHARLALVYKNAGTPESLAKAKAAAALALQLDDQLADAHISQANLLDQHDLEWSAAEREYLRALDLDPTSINAYYFYCVLLTRMGRFDEALAQLRRGEEAAPLNVFLEGLYGWTLGMQRHYDQSIDRLRKRLESDPNDYNLNLFLGDVYLHKGDFEHALLTFGAIESQAQRQPLVIGLEGYAHAVLGHTAEARKLLKRLEDLSEDRRVPPTSFAFIYIGLGDRDRAFQWLEDALLNDRFMLSGLKVWPVYDSLHRDPRYFALLAKLGLH